MCGGQGADDNLRRFPYVSLEKDAYEVLKNLT